MGETLKLPRTVRKKKANRITSSERERKGYG